MIVSSTHHLMELNKNQLALILDAIECYDGYGDYTSEDGKYQLTGDEVDKLISMVSEKLNPSPKPVPEIGSIRQSTQNPRNMVKVESYPYCKITYSYEELTHRTTPNYEGEPVLKIITYNQMPYLIVSYVMVSNPKDQHYIGKRTCYHYNGFQSTHKKIHTPIY